MPATHDMFLYIIFAIVILIIIIIAYYYYNVKKSIELWLMDDSIDCARNANTAECAQVLEYYTKTGANTTLFGVSLLATFIRSIFDPHVQFKAPVVSSKRINSKVDPTIPIACICELTNGDIWVLFRGTITAEDMKHDMDYLQSYNKQSKLGEYAVHSGLYEEYSTVSHQVLASTPKGRKTFICGHSMGAAFALYHGLAMRNSMPTIIAIAPPRAGNAEFAAIMSTLDVTSIINLADMVPSLPWSYMPSDVIDGTQYSHSGKLITFNLQGENILDCHNLKTYFNGLSAALLPAK